MMANHPNRSKRAPAAGRTPTQEEVVMLRSLAEHARGRGITDAQAWCARQLHVTPRAWQAWELGERRMHPAFHELARLKIVPPYA